MRSDYQDIYVDKELDETFSTSDNGLTREEEIKLQKEKRKQKEIKEKNLAKQEKLDKKKAERKKTIEKKKREKQHKQVKKQKAEIKKQIEKQQKNEEKERIAELKAKEKRKKELDKQRKIEEQRKREERERRIEQRKQQKEDDEFEYEANTAIKMTMKNNKRRKQEEEISKQQRKLIQQKRKIITVFSLIVIVVGGSAFALTSPIFYIKDIQVLGNSQVSSDTIKSLSGLNKDNSIFRFLKINVINSLKKEPYIENVEVRRILPNIVQIQVEERTKKYAIQFLNNYAFINNQGYILELTENPQELVILKGIATPDEQISAGNRLNDEDLERLETVIKIMNTFKDNGMDEQITSIEMTPENQYVVRIEKEQKTIYLGDKTNLSNKIRYVQAIVNETKGLIGEIFVNGDLNNKFKPYFREKVQ